VRDESLGFDGYSFVSGGLHASQSVLQSWRSVTLLRSKQLRIDAELADGRGAHFARVGDSADGRTELALGYDNDGLYVAARMYDDKSVRSARPSTDEDAGRPASCGCSPAKSARVQRARS
jgi:hypothetical protein